MWTLGNDGQLWLYEAIFIVFLLTAIPTVILERRRPAATIAWIFAFAFMPVIGFFAYLMLGRRRVRRSRRTRERQRLRHTEATREMANIDALPPGLDPITRGLINLALNTASAPLRRAESVELLPGGRQAFAAMTRAIASAKHRIHAEFYIWRDDGTGRDLATKLAKRAREGCAVRVLIDGLGTFGTPRSLFQELIDAGGTVARFGPLRFRFRRSNTRIDFRNHRKILCVDGKIAFTGGLNIGDEYSGADPDGPSWNDLWARFDGDATLSLEAIFFEDWQLATGTTLDPSCDLPHPQTGLVCGGRPITPITSSGPMLQIIPSGPNLPVASVLAAQFSAAIGMSQTRVWLTTPYFIPSSALLLVLGTAAMRGIDVRILVPVLGQNDSRVVGYAARSYYDDLLRAGCRIFEYQPRMIHSKYMLVDQKIATLGSANLDERSLHLMYEVTAMFYDEKITDELASVFHRDLDDAVEVMLGDRLQLPSWQRLLENSARLLAPLL